MNYTEHQINLPVELNDTEAGRKLAVLAEPVGSAGCIKRLAPQHSAFRSSRIEAMLRTIKRSSLEGMIAIKAHHSSGNERCSEIEVRHSLPGLEPFGGDGTAVIVNVNDIPSNADEPTQSERWKAIALGIRVELRKRYLVRHDGSFTAAVLFVHRGYSLSAHVSCDGETVTMTELTTIPN